MSTRHIPIVLALAVLATCCAASDTHEVKLTGGRTLIGVLRPASDGLYLLQAGEALYELSRSEIATVDGHELLPRLDAGRKFAHTRSYRRLLPDGDVEINESLTVRNGGETLQTYVEWGAAPQERYMYESMTALDAYGNRLEHRLEPRPGSVVRSVIVELAVPVMPGEDTEIMVRTVQRGAAALADGVWTYVHAGDYAEDRLQELKVELPAGAEVLTVDPLVKVVEYRGRSLVFWRRYYPEGTRFPLTVTYRLD